MKHTYYLALLFLCGTVWAQPFDHMPFDEVLRTHVDERGYVDYATLQANSTTLDAYIDSLGRVSPKSHPERFATEADRLAFWINAYNALTIRGVLDAYPVGLVKDIKILSGFFNRTWYNVGGRSYTLNDIEHGVLREAFLDPRIHAAINCASASCPRLESRAFLPEEIDARLEAAMRTFLNEERNVSVDVDAGKVRLSKILEWFEEDFLRWLEEERAVKNAHILNYVILYSKEAQRTALTSIRRPEVRYIDYDWSLNDQSKAASLQ